MRLRTRSSLIPAADTRPIKPAPKAAAPHYRTAEHAAWSAAVIRRSGFQCQDPRHDPARPRHGGRLFADHIVELAALRERGGVHNFLPAGRANRAGLTHRIFFRLENPGSTKLGRFPW